MKATDLVDLAAGSGGLTNDALLAAVLPLFRQTAEIHERGLVAPLRGLDRITVDEQSRLGFAPEAAARPVLAPAELAAREQRRATAVDVVSHQQLETDLRDGAAAPEVRVVEPRPDAVRAPVLVPGWQSWEHVVGHHDPLTDIFSLGQLLIALGCGLDLGRTDDVARLIVARGNLHALNPELHPVIASCAVQLADPERHRRSQDLHSVISALENYRDQPLDFDVDAITGAPGDRRTAVLTALRDRLFDLSRRNRLVNFRHTAQTLNLTEASVPLMLDVRNIRAEHLFTWNPGLAKRFLDGTAGGTAQVLGRWLRYDEAPYTATSLDTLISTARRDRAEYGQDQLRLVPAFLRWHDLKNDPDTRLSSPLLLVKVELAKKRGVRDSYTLRVTDPVAEVNPALRQHLHQLYGITLPERVDLSEGQDAVAALHARLAAEIARTEPGLTLHLRDRPRIDLVRHRAQLRLRSYRRRQHGNRAGEFGSRHYAYSYRRSDYQPLGLQIFRTQLCHTDLPLGGYLGEPVRPAHALDTDLYTLDTGTDGSPYSWDVDLCAVTLANFNYRTLGLVRDYDELLAGDRSCASFDQLFSDQPRPLSRPVEDLPIADRHLVVPADGSQVAAIARARRGESVVIQGPPGTGKSQTITNMIADFVARGRRVLFVCQKRAALDVVHSRLAGRNLDELCTLIHDSQADKKAFVHGLRDTYESWLTAGNDLDALTVRRDAAVARVESLLGTVRAFEEQLGAPGRPTVREIVNRLVELRGHRWGTDLPAARRRLLPGPADWWQGRPAVAAVAGAMPVGTFAGSPLSAVTAELWSGPAPDAEIPARAAVAERAWAAAGAAVDDVVARQPWAAELHDAPVERLRVVAELAAVAAPLAERGRSAVLDPATPAAQALRDEVLRHESLVTAARAAESAASGWREPLPEADARAALVVARRKQGSLFGFLSKDWRTVKRVVSTRYDASARAVRPTVTEVLTALVASYDASAAVRSDAARAGHDWGHEDLPGLARRLAGYAQSPDPAMARWRSALAAQPDPALAQLLGRLGAVQRSAVESSAGLLDDVGPRPLSAVRELTAALAAPPVASTIRTLTPAMRELAAAPAAVQVAVRNLAASPEQLEYAVCAAHWDRVRAAAPVLTELTSERLDGIVAGLAAATEELTDLDAAVVVARVRARFLDELAHSELSLTGMSEQDRARKKTFSAGRRLLEHEFGKVMRYRSIRELSSGDSGAVVAMLRPVWLMSPSSVSDTLPLDPASPGSGFDVVIYDEASQIPVEEAIPAMHRAPQVIVVGDQMQLPPTQYFQVAPRVDPELGVDLDLDPDDAEPIGVVLTEDSFLSVSALRLASTMLSWHYRSRSEALISFSNSAFYGGRLATIPDRVPPGRADAWTVLSASTAVGTAAGTAAGDGDGDGDGGTSGGGSGTASGGGSGTASGVDGLAEVAGAVLAGSITAVRVLDGVYSRRTNPAEASWIAHLVRELLGRETGDSIGIVAFSEAQQGEIERALERLAQDDPAFGDRYEAELSRTVDGQDVSLFVKNLENVQGDERDIVIMSICYAPGPDGRMLMNFGPINTAGGEKRLNVIFSRARKHMVVVSSIAPDAITNTYNDGANTLRRFLAYAEAVSRGDTEAARAALAPYAAARPRRTPFAAHVPRALTRAAGSARAHAGAKAGAPTVGPTDAPVYESTEAPAVGSTEAPAVGSTAAPAVGSTAAPAVGSTAAPAVGPTDVPDVPTTQAAVTVVGQLAETLRRRGVEVWPDIGESAFRCDLALRRPGDRGYRVAVLVDTPARIASDSTLERLSTHHRALAGAGWVVSDVLTSDWLRDPDSVTDRLIEVLDRTSPA